MTEVYIASTDTLCDENIFIKEYNKLPAFRKEKIDRLKLDSAKRLSLCAWMLLAYALGKRGIETFDVEYNDCGKPYLRDRADVFFNLSHSGNVCMCAVSDKEVGCDVQQIALANLKIAERFFHPDEVKLLNELPADQKNDMFYRIWTLKESFVKTIGKGMSIALSGFSFDFSHGVKVRQHVMPESDFYFKEFATENYKFSVCSMADGFSAMQFVQL